MIRFSVTIMRGCFGGCSFCSITEHEGRVIQSRSEASILREIERVRDNVPGLHGRHLRPRRPDGEHVPAGCKSPEIEAACRLPSCVYPGICPNLNTDHAPLIQLYRKARALPGIKKILVASGLRYDLAATSPEYVRELAHAPRRRLPEDRARAHRGRAAVEDDEARHRQLRKVQAAVRRSVGQGGKEAVPDPVLHRLAPGHDRPRTCWRWRCGSSATASAPTRSRPSCRRRWRPRPRCITRGRTRCSKVRRDGETVFVAKGSSARRLHKAFLRYHDPANWPLLRRGAAADGAGRSDRQRAEQADPAAPAGDGGRQAGRARRGTPATSAGPPLPHDARTLTDVRRRRRG